MRILRMSAALLLAVACNTSSGPEVEPEPDTVPDERDVDFTCDASAAPDELPLRRMSRTQHRNTLVALVGEAIPSQADEVVREIEPALDTLVPDSLKGPEDHYGRLSRLDQDVAQAHVDRTWDASVAVARSLTQGDRLDALADGCDPADRACLRSFVERFAPHALRRPVDSTEVDHTLTAIQDDPVSRADWQDVITLLLMHPDHIYLVESVQDDGESPPRLDPWALASRLSYHLWQAPPDAELRALAASGELLDDAVFEAQVDRLAADPRAREAVREFFSEWLGNTTLEALNSRLGTPVFDAFRGAYTPSDTLRQEMLDEVTDSVVWTLDHEGTWDDALTSDRSFARTQGLADLYEVPVWDGVSQPPQMTQPERAGLITRAAFVATGSANTRPIMKGVFLRKALLCDEIGDAPADVSGDPPPLSDHATTREVVANLTGQGSCLHCHERIINPLGFVTENFDALGRPRTHQSLYNDDGTWLTDVPVDTQVDAYVTGYSADPVSDAHDLTAVLVESPKPRACLSRHWFRFTFGRMEDDALDGCALAEVDEALDEGRSLREALRSIALTDAFKRRTVTGE